MKNNDKTTVKTVIKSAIALLILVICVIAFPVSLIVSASVFILASEQLDTPPTETEYFQYILLALSPAIITTIGLATIRYGFFTKPKEGTRIHARHPDHRPDDRSSDLTDRNGSSEQTRSVPDDNPSVSGNGVRDTARREHPLN